MADDDGPSITKEILALIERLADPSLTPEENRFLGSELRALQRRHAKLQEEETSSRRHSLEDHRRELNRALRGKRRPPVSQIVVTGSDNVINSGPSVNRTGSGIQVTASSDTSEEVTEPKETKRSTLAEQRQAFHFDFLKHSLTTSEVTFWISICVMTLGAIIFLAGVTFVLFRQGNESLKWITSLSGVVIGAGGGVLNRHARQARADVTKQAERVEGKIDADDRYEKATALIERVQDPTLKDRLTGTAVLKQLELTPDAEETAKRLIAPQSTPRSEIEPGTGPAPDEHS
ncbi:TRADD-N-associated membrane domain-containing protein [Streptomyces sp. NPDC054933]